MKVISCNNVLLVNDAQASDLQKDLKCFYNHVINLVNQTGCDAMAELDQLYEQINKKYSISEKTIINLLNYYSELNGKFNLSNIQELKKHSENVINVCNERLKELEG